MLKPDDESLESKASDLRRDMARNPAFAPGWSELVATVPRHRFIPGFYRQAAERSRDGLPVWLPVTPAVDPDQWLAAAYSDVTLVTQLDGDEPDWEQPSAHEGGAPTSSSTQPSLVVRMWADTELRPGHRQLAIGTGTGYSTALACERLGDGAVTSIEIDARRLEQAATALHGCGHTPTLAVADGRYGYWPRAPFDRIVAACSVRAVPAAWLAQVRPGGKILTTLGGWLYGYARTLLTVAENGFARGPLLPGTISFMAARGEGAPPFGNPTHWREFPPSMPARPTRHDPARITQPTAEAFFARFLAQSAVPDAQMVMDGDLVQLVDVVAGAAATLTPTPAGWQVSQAGPTRLWDRVENVLDAYDRAGRPEPETFVVRVDVDGQHLWHPQMPPLSLPA